MSAARHALLGLLADRPAYGYELANRLAELLGPTWVINPGQVSHTLRALQKQGLITPVTDAPQDRKGRQVMAITPKGLHEVERWWMQQPARAIALARRPLLVKLALARPERLQAALNQIEVYRRDCAVQLNEIARQHDAVPQGPPVRTDRVLLRLGLRGDMVQLKAELEWAKDAHDVVYWLLHRDSLPTGPARRVDEERDAQRRLFDRMATGHLHDAADEQAGGADHAAP